jgi:hypothetical protein
MGKAGTSETAARADKDGRNAKESEVTRDRQREVVVYLHRRLLTTSADCETPEHDMEHRFAPLNGLNDPKSFFTTQRQPEIQNRCQRN